MKTQLTLLTLLIASFSCFADEGNKPSQSVVSNKAGATEYIILLCAAPGGEKFIVRSNSDGTGMPCIKATDNGTGR